MSDARRLGEIIGRQPAIYSDVHKKCPLCLKEWTGYAFSPDFAGGNAHIARCDECIDRLEAEWQSRNVPVVRVTVTDLLPPKRVRE